MSHFDPVAADASVYLSETLSNTKAWRAIGQGRKGGKEVSLMAKF